MIGSGAGYLSAGVRCPPTARHACCVKRGPRRIAAARNSPLQHPACVNIQPTRSKRLFAHQSPRPYRVVPRFRVSSSRLVHRTRCTSKRKPVPPPPGKLLPTTAATQTPTRGAVRVARRAGGAAQREGRGRHRLLERELQPTKKTTQRKNTLLQRSQAATTFVSGTLSHKPPLLHPPHRCPVFGMQQSDTRSRESQAARRSVLRTTWTRARRGGRKAHIGLALIRRVASRA